MKLILIGLRGTGKSTVGQLLADRLGWPCFDTDSLVQERAGMSIRELFEQQGEAVFRSLECVVVQECAGRDQVVIACGGGAILDLQNVSALKNNGFVVHLTADPAELWHRIARDPSSHATRPKLLADAESGIDELKKLMRARSAAYAHARDAEVSVDDRSPDEVTEAILLLMRGRGVIG